MPTHEAYEALFPATATGLAPRTSQPKPFRPPGSATATYLLPKPLCLDLHYVLLPGIDLLPQPVALQMGSSSVLL